MRWVMVVVVVYGMGCGDDDTEFLPDAMPLDSSDSRPIDSGLDTRVIPVDSSLPDTSMAGDSSLEDATAVDAADDAALIFLFRCHGGICGESYLLCTDESAPVFEWHDCTCVNQGECP